jgi:hypothetical protein
LTGSLLQEGCGGLHVYGTLNQPLHAGNLVAQLDSINQGISSAPKLPLMLGRKAGRTRLVRLRDDRSSWACLVEKTAALGNYTISGLEPEGQGRLKIRRMCV